MNAFPTSAAMALLCLAQVTACGGGGDEGVTIGLAAHQEAAAAHSPPPTPWRADGLALTTPAGDRPVDPAARWSGERHATREQRAFEQVTASPYTMVLEADDEAGNGNLDSKAHR